MTGPPRMSLPSWVDELDELVDRSWEPLRRSRAANGVFYGASAVGDFSILWHGINFYRLVSGAADRREFLRLAAALGVESLIVNQVLKRMFRRDRPTPPADRPHHLRTPSTSSFPSGHASSASMAAVLLAERSRAGGLYGAVATVVATSRLHVRIHHASDVLAGAVIGTSLGMAVRRIVPLGPRGRTRSC